MWKRDQAPRPAPPTPSSEPAPSPAAVGAADTHGRVNVERVNFGKSVIVRGEVTGSEDLVIDGQVDGTIQLDDHVLTIGPHGRVHATVTAKAVIVLGRVQGNVTARERIEIRQHGAVDGDLTAPRVAIADGAHFRGMVDMRTAPTPATNGPSSVAEPVAPLPGGQAPRLL